MKKTPDSKDWPKISVQCKKKRVKMPWINASSWKLGQIYSLVPRARIACLQDPYFNLINLRASSGWRWWIGWQFHFTHWAIPPLSFRLLLYPRPASFKVWSQPLPSFWGHSGCLRRKFWISRPWFLHLLGCRQFQLDSILPYEVTH